MAEKEKFTLVLDSSQISLFLECPMQWYYQYVLKLIPIGVVQDKSAMHSGTYGHKILDVYYKKRAEGLNMNQAASDAFSYNIDDDTCECGCTKEHHKFIELFNIHECQRCGKCSKWRPQPFDLKAEDRVRVQNRLREYFFNYAAADFVPLSPEHVEVGFSEPIYEDHENLFILEGRIDLIATLQGLNCIVDHKFQMQRHWLYPKSVQFKNYALIAKSLMFFINYIRLSKSVDKDTMTREPICFTVPELLAWKQKLIKIYFDIKKTIHANSYEQRWSACKGYGKTYDREHPSFCSYTTLCEENDSKLVQIKKDQFFKVNEVVWRPW